MMDCERTDLLLGWLEEALEPEERLAVEDHLARCAACREALEGYRATARALASLEPPAPSEAARASAYAAVLQAMEGAPAAAPAGGAPRGRLLRFAPLAGAAAAAAVLAVATMRPSRPAPGALAEAPEAGAAAPEPLAARGHDAPLAPPAPPPSGPLDDLIGDRLELGAPRPERPAPREALAARDAGPRQALEPSGGAAEERPAGAPPAAAPELAALAQRREPLAVWRVRDEAGERLYALFADGVQGGAWSPGASASAEPEAGASAAAPPAGVAGRRAAEGGAGPEADGGAGPEEAAARDLLAEAKAEGTDPSPPREAPSVVPLEPSAAALLETAAVSAADLAVAGDLLAILARELEPAEGPAAKARDPRRPSAGAAGAPARPRRPEVVLTLFAALGQHDLAPDAALPELRERLRALRERWLLRERELEAEEASPDRPRLERAREAR